MSKLFIYSRLLVSFIANICRNICFNRTFNEYVLISNLISIKIYINIYYYNLCSLGLYGYFKDSSKDFSESFNSLFFFSLLYIASEYNLSEISLEFNFGAIIIIIIKKIEIKFNFFKLIIYNIFYSLILICF